MSTSKRRGRETRFKEFTSINTNKSKSGQSTTVLIPDSTGSNVSSAECIGRFWYDVTLAAVRCAEVPVLPGAAFRGRGDAQMQFFY